MSIPLEMFFGVPFLIVAMIVFYQGILLKANKLNARLFSHLNPRAMAMLQNAPRERINKLGNISIIIAAILLTQALLFFIYPLSFSAILTGGFICMFITILVGIFCVFR